MDEIAEKLQSRIGPLAAWEWGALVGGGLLVFRLVSQGHKTTGVTTVTLTPNNQPNLPSSSGQDTAGSIISGLNTLGFAPGNFSFTLPNGTVVTWTNSGISTSPPPTTPGPTPSNPASPGRGVGISPLVGPNLLPTGRGGGVIPGVSPNPLPGGRGGGAIPGVTPNPLPNVPGVPTIQTPVVPSIGIPAWFRPVTPPPRPGGPIVPVTPPAAPGRR